MSSRLSGLAQSNEEENQDWIFSYADLMSLLLGFFIILFSMSSLNKEKFEELGQSISEAMTGDKIEESKPSELDMQDEKRKLRALKMVVAMMNWQMPVEDAVRKIESSYEKFREDSAIAEDLKRKLGMNKETLKDINGVYDEQALVELVLPTKTLFPSGGTEVLPAALDDLRAVANTISSFSNVIEVEVEGHTDHLPPSGNGVFADNWALSAARAGAVAKVLIGSGVEKGKIRATGMADLKPLFPERGDNGALDYGNMARNRRVHIRIKKVRNEVSKFQK